MDIPFVYGKIADGMNFTDREEDSSDLRECHTFSIFHKDG